MSGPNIHANLGDMIDCCPGAASVLMQLGIDCRLHGQQSLHQICVSEGMDPHTVLEVIMFEDVPLIDNDERDWSAENLNQLADYVVARHHEYLRRQLPRVQILIDKALHDQGDRYPELKELDQVFRTLRTELESHLVKEEELLFPAIRELVWAKQHPGTFEDQIDRPIADLGHEFEGVAHNLGMLRQMMNNFKCPSDACTAYQSLAEELSHLEADLQRHEYLENRILFPKAIALENELTG